MARFNAKGPTDQIDRRAPGSTPKFDAAQRRALAEIVGKGPMPAIHGLVRRRLIELVKWAWEEFRVSVI